ncbi:MAG: hypothetical protein Q4C40_05670 [Eubacteriales bacterium]|nr:hypothetical protein [Eubacteriales bacterium]
MITVFRSHKQLRWSIIAAIIVACIAAIFYVSESQNDETAIFNGAEHFFIDMDEKQIVYYFSGEVPYDEALLGAEVETSIRTKQTKVYQPTGKTNFAELLMDQVQQGEHSLTRFTYGGIVKPKYYTLQEDMYYFGLTSVDDIACVETSLWDGYGDISPQDFPIYSYTDRETMEQFYHILTEGSWLNADEYAREQYKAEEYGLEQFQSVDYTMWSITMRLKNGSSYKYCFCPDSYSINFYYGDYHILLTTKQSEWMERACGITEDVKKACMEIYG